MRSSWLEMAELDESSVQRVLEFCREPGLLAELYEIYDCDVQGTNLFEHLARQGSGCRWDVQPI